MSRNQHAAQHSPKVLGNRQTVTDRGVQPAIQHTPCMEGGGGGRRQRRTPRDMRKAKACFMASTKRWVPRVPAVGIPR